MSPLSRTASTVSYAELSVFSNFSFLRGAAHPDELILTAKALGLRAMALTDVNSLAGIVRAHSAARDHDMPFIPGCCLELVDGRRFLAWPENRDAYGRLASLLTIGNRRAEKGACHLQIDDLIGYCHGIRLALVAHNHPDEPALTASSLTHIKRLLTDAGCPAFYIAISVRYDGRDTRRIAHLGALANRAKVKPLAVGDIRFHEADRRPLADVLTAIRHHVTLEEAGYLLPANSERFIKPAAEMARLFSALPDAIRHSVEIADACTFSLDELAYNYPSEPVPQGETPQSQLARLADAGARWRFPDGIPKSVRDAIQHELALIADLDYAPYFLTVHDIVQFARSRGILCQGRGSAANSVVCFCLGITAVDPTKVNLLFERFISSERGEPPDIDVDFEHNRREEVIQYIYARYGRHRAALAATLITYRPRSAIREVGKVMGLSEDTVGALAGTVWGPFTREVPVDRVTQAGLDINDPRLATAMDMAQQLVGFPRHLSQHVGGFVLTETPLSEVVPIQNAAMEDRTVIEWDKDDLETLKILKIDVLALGMLTALSDAFRLLRDHYDIRHTLASLPPEDPDTYAMLGRADSIGVFQVESRAQMSMLPRLKPSQFYDLVVQVAIVRPGPIQGDMVHPYLRRRQGKEAVDFPSPAPEHGEPDELKSVLAHTYGVPLFQEQAMRIAIVAAGFAPGEADGLRRAMATFRRTGSIGDYRDRFIGGMTRRGYDEDFAERCFGQIEGFADYGFPESHAASFALLVYASSYLKCHYPAAFACALLNAQPMGFYAPAQLVRDARDHGVEIRPVDINTSTWDHRLEPVSGNRWRCAVRLGFRQVKGLKQAALEDLVHERGALAFKSIREIQQAARISVAQLEILADADAFRSIGISRREALWQVRGLIDSPDLPLFTHAASPDHGADPAVDLPVMGLGEEVATDYQTLRLSLKAHPLALLRPGFDKRRVIQARQLLQAVDGDRVSVAGLVLVRQRPGSAKGVVFLTLEDESGVANIVVWQRVFERSRKIIMGSRLILVKGQVQKEDGVIHVVAGKLEDCSLDLLTLTDDHVAADHAPLDPPLARADEVANGSPPDPKDVLAAKKHRLPPLKPSRHPRNVRDLVPKSRDFH